MSCTSSAGFVPAETTSTFEGSLSCLQNAAAICDLPALRVQAKMTLTLSLIRTSSLPDGDRNGSANTSASGNVGNLARGKGVARQHRKVAKAEAVFDALRLPMRRAMVSRLSKRGAMSLSKFGKTFRISLPATLKRVRILEETGIVKTHKQGRVRICVYNPSAFRGLASEIASRAAFWESSFDRLERHGSKRKEK